MEINLSCDVRILAKTKNGEFISEGAIHKRVLEQTLEGVTNSYTSDF